MVAFGTCVMASRIGLRQLNVLLVLASSDVKRHSGLISQAAHGELVRIRLALVRLRRHDGVDVGGGQGLQLVGAGNPGGRHGRAHHGKPTK
jgi:hypothetical protein